MGHHDDKIHTLAVTEDEAGKTSGRKERLRGQIGVRTMALSDGWTIGPPADNEYAVDPVGVAPDAVDLLCGWPPHAAPVNKFDVSFQINDTPQQRKQQR